VHRGSASQVKDRQGVLHAGEGCQMKGTIDRRIGWCSNSIPKIKTEHVMTAWLSFIAFCQEKDA